ncbi:MAG: thiamine pyridinylase [Candidatus Parabeggiatoa sp.]|nr:thiamine pyridinylase [Candidatus Parabeggiatoa sp.]
MMFSIKVKDFRRLVVLLMIVGLSETILANSTEDQLPNSEPSNSLQATTTDLLNKAEDSNPVQATLKVGLYPLVPRIKQFEIVIQKVWEERGVPGVELAFVSHEVWDGGYAIDPPDDLDVFVFDALFLQYFQTQGYLAAIEDEEIEALSDILPYALEGSRIKGKLFGIPQLGCTNLLFYRKNDRDLAKARTLDEISGILGKCPYTGVTPPPETGLMVDLSGSTTNASLYLETVMDIKGEYTPVPQLPTVDQLNPQAIFHLQKVLGMANKRQASSDYFENPYQRASWFGKGFGRAVIGFTESMSAMGVNQYQIDFKLMPLANNPKEDVPLFYVDMVGINALVAKRGLQKAAIQLANLLASQEVIVQSLVPSHPTESPQYLMPVRRSVFSKLWHYPLYRKMYRLVKNKNPRMFKIGDQSRQWLNHTKRAIQDKIFDIQVCN